jgi:tripartite-type tricarboxylate transporter receptor subunit TctC
LISQNKRLALAPDLPTMIEAGLPGYDAAVWIGLLAPAGTAPEIVDRLARAANEALQADDVLTPLRAQGFEPAGGSPEDFGRTIAGEMTKWADVARAAGLKSK